MAKTPHNSRAAATVRLKFLGITNARCAKVLQGCPELPSLSFSAGSAGFFFGHTAR
jgi:hypothetical protein